jgi:TRAP-type C4-dicarboxylate transport system permease small subunit
VRRFETWFVEANKWILAVLLAAMSVIVFANVTLRYLTHFSITWSEEVARYLMIWMTFLGTGLALRYGLHVAITNLQEILPPLLQRLARALVVLLLAAFLALMVLKGYDYMMRARFQLTPATRIPFSYIYAAMPIGFVLTAIHLALVVRAYLAENRFERLDAGEEAG